MDYTGGGSLGISRIFHMHHEKVKMAIDMIEGLYYKLRMMGIPLAGPTSVFCDNESVVKNLTAPESTLKKHHNAIAYHRAR